MSHWSSGAPGAAPCAMSSTSIVGTVRGSLSFTGCGAPAPRSAPGWRVPDGTRVAWPGAPLRRRSRPARGESPRRALERVHLDAGVLAERREMAARREVARFGDGVLREVRAAFQVQLVGQSLEDLVDRKHELDGEAGEDVADLACLAIVARRD